MATNNDQDIGSRHNSDNGMSNLTGMSGMTGMSGITGMSGLTGLSGITGMSGMTGISGISNDSSNNGGRWSPHTVPSYSPRITGSRNGSNYNHNDYNKSASGSDWSPFSLERAFYKPQRNGGPNQASNFGLLDRYDPLNRTDQATFFDIIRQLAKNSSEQKDDVNGDINVNVGGKKDGENEYELRIRQFVNKHGEYGRTLHREFGDFVEGRYRNKQGLLKIDKIGDLWPNFVKEIKQSKNPALNQYANDKVILDAYKEMFYNAMKIED